MAKNNINLQSESDYLTPGWLTLFATAIVMTLIFVLFTPYTHQLDEIKNVYLMIAPPFLLLAALWQKDFSKISWRNDSPTMFCGLWVVAMVCSYIVNPYKLTAERVVWFQTGCLTFTLIFAWLMNTENKMRKSMFFITLLGFISVVFGLFFFAGRGFTDAIYNYMKGDPMWSRDYREWMTLFYTLKESRQMYSTILNEDFYAAFLVMTTAIPLAMFIVEKDSFWKRLFAFCTFLLMNVCLVFTNSNDSYSATVLILYPLFFFLSFRYLRREEWGLTRSVVLTFIIGSVILTATVLLLQSPKIMQTWEFKSEAFEGRKILWGGGIMPWLKGTDFNNPHFSPITAIFGTGPGGYRFYFPVWRNPLWFDNQINNVTTFGHNWYIDVLMEYGLFGLFSFLGLHITILVRGLRQIATTTVTSRKCYQIALITGLCAVALQNFFSPNNRWAVCGMIYWTMFGLSMGLTMLDIPEDVQPPSMRKLKLARRFKYAAYAFALLFLVRAVPQGFNYWTAAKLNSLGIRAMDLANYPGLPEGEQLRYLKEARQVLEGAIKANPSFATSYYKLAHVQHSLGDSDAAIKTYEMLNKVFPYYSELNWNLGTMYFSKAVYAEDPETQRDAMIKSWENMRIAARQSRKPGVQYRIVEYGLPLAKIYDREGETSKALAIREEMKDCLWHFITYEPKLPELKLDKKENYTRGEQRLVQLCNETSDTQGLIKILQRMYNEHPENSLILNQILLVYKDDNDTSGMLAFMKDAVDNAPIDPKLRETYAFILKEAGDEAGAAAEMKRVAVLKALEAAQTSDTETSPTASAK